MIPTDEEIELDSCCKKCKRGCLNAWGFCAMVLWGGFFAAFYYLRLDQVEAAGCPEPWHMFFLVDTAFQAVYYITGFIASCFTDDHGDLKVGARYAHMFRYCVCIPYSFIWWIVGIVWFVNDIECLNFEAVNEPWGRRAKQPFPFFVTAAAYMAIRMFQNYMTWIIMCLQCSALNTFRKQDVITQITEIKDRDQPIAASHTIQNWAVIVGIPRLQIDTLVGYGAAEEYRRRKRDLEEGYQKYKNRKRAKWRRRKVVHVQTVQEKQEELAELSLKSKPKTVFPFMRMTEVVKDSDMSLENPFEHLGQGSTDIVAANKAAALVEKAAARVAARLGAEHVGVAARRGV